MWRGKARGENDGERGGPPSGVVNNLTITSLRKTKSSKIFHFNLGGRLVYFNNDGCLQTRLLRRGARSAELMNFLSSLFLCAIRSKSGNKGGELSFQSDSHCAASQLNAGSSLYMTSVLCLVKMTLQSQPSTLAFRFGSRLNANDGSWGNKGGHTEAAMEE